MLSDITQVPSLCPQRQGWSWIRQGRMGLGPGRRRRGRPGPPRGLRRLRACRSFRLGKEKGRPSVVEAALGGGVDRVRRSSQKPCQRARSPEGGGYRVRSGRQSGPSVVSPGFRRARGAPIPVWIEHDQGWRNPNMAHPHVTVPFSPCPGVVVMRPIAGQCRNPHHQARLT